VLAGESCSNEDDDVAAADSEICYRNWSVANTASGVTELFL